MKTKPLTACAVAGILAITPLSPASAHGGWHGHGPGPIVGLAVLGTALVVGAAAILTAPVRAIAEAPAPYYGPPQPAYYQPPAQAYAGPPVYYAQPTYYNQAPAYYYPPQAYYR